MIDIRNCHTVCLALGPYRNLTTLTAATLFLHPGCQVLNHAGGRILGDARYDFLLHNSKDTVDRFLTHAVEMSLGGERGDAGGSILLSHAFDDIHPMRALYTSVDGRPLKKRIDCLFWKESLRTSLHIRQHGIDVGALLHAEPRLRFMMPVRNPLDCAASNMATGHAALFPDLPKRASTTDVLRAVLRELAWFGELQQKHPDRFHSFFEFEISRLSLSGMASFLGLEPNRAWLDAAQAAMTVRRGRQHEPGLIAAYRAMVQELFEENAQWSMKLLRFVGDGPTGEAS